MAAANPSRNTNRRPWWMLVVTVAGAGALIGLALTSAQRADTAANPALGWFDVLFGVTGALVLLYSVWRALRALGGRGELSGVWAVVVGVAVLRLTLLAQADYDRGRLPFFMMLALVLAAAGLVRHRRNLHRKDASS